MKRTTLLCTMTLFAAMLTANAGELSVDVLNVNQQGNFYGQVNVTPVPAGDIATNDLVLHYDFATDTTSVPDLSGNGHVGTVYGALWTNDGARGGAYWFDGNNDYILAPNTSLLNITGQLSVAFWMKPIYKSSSQCPIARNKTSDTSTNAYWNFSLSKTGDLTWNVNTDVQLTFNEDWYMVGWTHVCIVHQDAVSWLYINGVLFADGGGDSIPSATKNILIGRNNLGNYFKGVLDEVVIYKRSLTSVEVQNLYYATGTFANNQSGTVNVSNTLTVANAVIQSNPQGTNVFAGKMVLDSGISRLAPLGDISMGAYTNAP